MRARGRSGGCVGRALTVTNETGGYDATLEQFARGKRLARLAKYVRARSDDHCDACGSTLPRLLFGLKDAQTERCYRRPELPELASRGRACRARSVQTQF